MEKEKKQGKFSKEVLNIIRTTMRNNIDLTHIADNKANVLLTLNALMLTFFIPLIIPYVDIVQEYRLWLPMLSLVLTCLVTIYLSVLVLRPGKFFQYRQDFERGKDASPFFFGNFYKMEKEEYKAYIKKAVLEPEKVKDYITNDLHFIGARLGRKMTLIRLAFNIFLYGLIGSSLWAIGLVYYYGSF